MQLGLGAALATLTTSLLVACSSNYQVTITVSDAVNSSCTTSCVRSVLLFALGSTNSEAQCVSEVSMPSLREHGLTGRFDLEAPDGVAGVNLTGFRSPDCSGMAIFDGIGTIEGDQVRVPMECLSSCSEQAPMAIKTVDLFAAMQGRCEAGIGTAARSGVLASDRWNLVVDAAPNTTGFYPGVPATLVAGEASLADAAFSVGRPLACPAVLVERDNAPISIACARRYRGVCLGAADSNKVEVATLSGAVLTAPSGEIRSLAVFAERDPTTQLPKPIAGATVTIELLSAPARIEYHDLTIQGGVPVLTTRAQASTGPSGAFSVYSREPVTIAISHAGRTYRRQIGGGLIEFIGTVVPGAQIITPE